MFLRLFLLLEISTRLLASCPDAFSPFSWKLSPLEYHADKSLGAFDIRSFEISFLVPVHKEFRNGNLLRLLKDIELQTAEIKKIRVLLHLNNTQADRDSRSQAYLDNQRLKEEVLSQSSTFKNFKKFEIHWIMSTEEKAPVEKNIGRIRRRLEDEALKIGGISDHHVLQLMDADSRLPPHFVKHVLARYARDSTVDAVLSSLKTRILDPDELTFQPHVALLYPEERANVAAIELSRSLFGLFPSSPVRVSIRSSAAHRHHIKTPDAHCGEDALLCAALFHKAKIAHNWSAQPVYGMRARNESYDGAIMLKDLETKDIRLMFAKKNNFSIFLTHVLESILTEPSERRLLLEKADQQLTRDIEMRNWLRFLKETFTSIIDDNTIDLRLPVTNILIANELESLGRFVGATQEFYPELATQWRPIAAVYALYYSGLDYLTHFQDTNIENIAQSHRNLATAAAIRFLGERSIHQNESDLLWAVMKLSRTIRLLAGQVAVRAFERGTAALSRLSESNLNAASYYIALGQHLEDDRDFRDHQLQKAIVKYTAGSSMRLVTNLNLWNQDIETFATKQTSLQKKALAIDDDLSTQLRSCEHPFCHKAAHNWELLKSAWAR